MNRLFLDIEKHELKGKIFIAGFHGIGSVGWIAVNYLSNKLNAKRIGIIITENMPLFVTCKGNSIITPYELCLANDFLFLKCNFPIPFEEANKVLENLKDLIKENIIREAFLIGGLDSRLRKEEDNRVRYVCTSYLMKDTEKKITKNENLTKLEEGLYIVGPLALLLSYFEAFKVSALTVLPYARIDRPDPEAALEAVKVFSYIYDIKIDYSGLIKQAKEFEKYLNEIQKKLEEIQKKEHKLIYI